MAIAKTYETTQDWLDDLPNKRTKNYLTTQDWLDDRSIEDDSPAEDSPDDEPQA